MLQILTNLNLLQRYDLEASAWVLENAVTGSFVELDGDDGVKQPTAGNKAFPIWTESYRDGTANWSPDVGATGNVTIIIGTMRAVTDQFDGTPTVGAPLYVKADGELTTTSAGNALPVAICTKASHSATYLSKPFTAIEFVTI